jgi:hypothetical protein
MELQNIVITRRLVSGFFIIQHGTDPKYSLKSITEPLARIEDQLQMKNSPFEYTHAPST